LITRPLTPDEFSYAVGSGWYFIGVGSVLFYLGYVCQRWESAYWVITNNILIAGITIMIFAPQAHPITSTQIIGATIAYSLIMYGLPTLSKKVTHRLPYQTPYFYINTKPIQLSKERYEN
jgi:hypothetical protein